MDKKEPIFAKGLYFQKREQAPSYVVGALSVKVAEFSAFIAQNQNNAGYCNIDIKQSKGGKYYAELNTFTPQKKEKISDTSFESTPF